MKLQVMFHAPVILKQDRAEAIKQAIQRVTDQNDAVIIAGKGADKFQLVNDKREPYPGDRAVAEKFI